MLGNLLNNIPPVTLALIFVMGFVGLLSYGQIVDKYNFYFSFEKIFYQGQVILTLIEDMASYNISCMLQTLKLVLFLAPLFLRSSFKRGSIDFLYFLAQMCAFIYFFAIILKISFLSNIFRYAMYYYYGRIHSNHILIVNLLPMRASFFVWFILMTEWIFGSHDLKSCLLSIAIGHTLYFIYNVYPKMRFVDKKDLFDTPNFLYGFALFSIQLVTPLFNEEHLHQNNNDENMFIG